MPRTLQLHLLVLLAMSVSTAHAVAQVPVDPFTGGSYAVPIGAPIDLSGDPSAAAMMGDPVLDGSMSMTGGPIVTAMDPSFGGPMVSGNSAFMAPEMMGGTIGGPLPGSDCPTCNAGGGMPMGMTYGTAMPDPTFGPSPGMPISPSPMPLGAPMMGPGMGIPMGNGVDPPETIYPGYIDPTADIPAGTGFEGFGASSVPPVLTAPAAPPAMPSATIGTGQRCGWAAGFTFVFLRPHYGSNDAFYIGTPAGAGHSVSNHEFSYSMDLSPRLFLEWVAPNDFGVRVTWFSFNNSADVASATAPPLGYVERPISGTQYPGGRVSAGNDVSLSTLDFDLTQRFRVYRSLINVGGGLRWANYEQNYTSTVSNPAFGTAEGNAGHQFNGFGPSLFAEWRRPIADSRFSLLATLRGSMLYGEAKTDVYERGLNGSSLSFQAENDDFVAVGESQLGGEWSAWLNDRTVFFVQAAFETQYWMGVGTAFDRNDDLGLIGVNTTLGLEW